MSDFKRIIHKVNTLMISGDDEMKQSERPDFERYCNINYDVNDFYANIEFHYNPVIEQTLVELFDGKEVITARFKTCLKPSEWIIWYADLAKKNVDSNLIV
jgi:hypothetical protein